MNRFRLIIFEIVRLCKSTAIRFAKEPLVKVTCTLIAALLGGWLGATFQENSWKEQYKLSMIESDRKQAEEIFKEVSRLMDDRYYKTRRLLSAYSQNDSSKIQMCRQSLILQLEGWNANRHRMYSLIEGYYGSKFVNFFKTNIQKPFATTGNHIIYSGAKTIEDQIKLKKHLESIESNIELFNKLLLDAIISNKVGRFSEDRGKVNI